MNQPEDQQHIIRFLNKQHVLTLCASNGMDMWCASCFYVFDAERMALWLMTESHTRHGELMRQNSAVVGTVAPQPKTVALIKGVQYAGKIRQLEGDDALLAGTRYCKRFPVAKVMKAPIWQIDLQEVKMTDNTLGFGKKLHWRRS
ncbi:YhbP family protein [Serratia sp. UGAL515B_01]|uniref:YhbP family protein n=1 Tax=Serratia sp. UGAL515B_01 TaxID=2986763 RepID=UPI002955980B|nr:YhbP family protein [Serratia sp. UGAL515B_01]WON77339.1 YhbP family protein [Serratia sp. UGAL515B_01]